METIRIYPFKKDKNTFNKASWWTVLILHDPKELRKTVTKKDCKTCGHTLGGSKDCLGLTHGHSFKVTCDEFGNILKSNIKGEIGIVYLQKKNIGAGVVAHELCHATLYTIMRYTNAKNFMDGQFPAADEKIAGINGNLHNAFWNGYEKV